MSLLNDVLQSVLSKSSAPAQEAGAGQGQADVLMTAALAMLDKAGGIQGVIEKFQNSGLGDVVASWVGTGENQAVSPDQITQALGQETVAVVTQETQLPAGQGGNILAELLPVIIDKLTPQGQVPEQGQLMDLGKSLLGALASSGVFGNKTSA
jgi:uncharacterized protein YidB (DUF937 family)